MTEHFDIDGLGRKDLVFLPLGGAGEIGMNLNLYGHDGKWLMVDLGITFGDDSTPGVEVIMPDPSFIVERKKDLAGLVLTHAHEDHLGAVHWLWPQLECPIYATPFTAAVLRRKLAEAGLEKAAKITEIPMSGRFDVGPFGIELITLTHSIPEPNAVVIRTGAGTVLHTGDWKLDPDPVIGASTDEAALMRVGEEGVLAMVCDSTNVLVPGTSGSEADVRDNLIELVGTLENRVAVAAFASNVARLDSVCRAAQANGRRVALVGRSMKRIVEAAQETGYLKDLPPFIADSEVNYLPRNEVLLICTGSQGEPRSALSRIAADDHPEVTLDAGDTVIFSSREIPGNERSIGRLLNKLASMGIDIVTARDEYVHVSGHPAKDELIQMYQWVRPKIAVPVHGEARHLIAHAELARDCQVPEPVGARNGYVVRLAPGRATVVDEVSHGRIAVDGNRLIPMESAALRDRRRAAWNGSAVVTVVVDRDGRVKDTPMVAVNGVFDQDVEPEIAHEVEDAVMAAVEDLPKARRKDDAQVREAARVAVRRSIRALCGKKPRIEVHLVRV
ncbi:MAG: ribonuclease J [Alphaproteobacteria bacterium]|jgi:ribonuclease J|nr:ribonuclease J [Alphaproteobacteria bacterium]